MARVLHPAYFPAGRQAPSCSYWGDFDLPLEKKMEAYWRVRKWSINISATFNEGNSTTGASGILDVSSRGNEANLVCPAGVRNDLNPIGEMGQEVYAVIDSVGFYVYGVSFDDIILNWPAPVNDPEANFEVLLKIGNYEIITYAVLAGAGSYTSTNGIVQAIEWWPYENEQGQALYNTSTGQPL